MDYNEYKEIKEMLLNHMYCMGNLKKNDTNKKKQSVLDVMSGVLLNEGTIFDINFLKEFLKDIKEGKVLDISVLDKGGNLCDFVNPKWFDVVMSLYRIRILKTPHEVTGEGEFMFIFCSPKIGNPTKDDITNIDTGKIYDLKGEGAKLESPKSGKEFRELTLKIAEKYGINPNISKAKTKVYAFELEKLPYREYYLKQFDNMTLEIQNNIVNDWLKCIDGKDHKDSVERIFIENKFNQDFFIKEIIIILRMIDIDKNYVWLGNGTNIQIVPKESEKFRENIYNGLIPIKKDYFRIDQSNKIGWYIY